MRILFVGISGYQYPHVRVRCYHFARELAKHGYETAVLSFRDHLSPGTSEAMMYGLGDKAKLKLTGRALWRLLRDPQSLIVLQKLHYHSGAPNLLRRLGLRPMVFDLDDWDEHCLAMFRRPWLNRFFFGPGGYPEIVGRLASGSPVCIVASHALQDLISAHNANTHVIETGVDTDRFQYAPRRRRNSLQLIWTGLVWGETVFNSVSMMLESFSRVRSRNPRVALNLLAGGQWLPEVKRLIATEYGRLPIKLLDWVEPGEVPDLLRASDIGLLPFVANTVEEERWIRGKSPTKLFEYMSTGLPTVASAIGEVNHVIEDGVHGYLAEDADAFTQKLVDLVESEGRRSEMGRAARRRIDERYSLVRLGEKLASVLSEFR